MIVRVSVRSLVHSVKARVSNFEKFRLFARLFFETCVFQEITNKKNHLSQWKRERRGEP